MHEATAALSGYERPSEAHSYLSKLSSSMLRTSMPWSHLASGWPAVFLDRYDKRQEMEDSYAS